MDKKGQFVRAWMREQRSIERESRIRKTGYFLNKGWTVERIAVEFGVSANTVNSYIKELEELKNKDRDDEIQRKKEEELNKKKKAVYEKRLKTIKQDLSKEIAKLKKEKPVSYLLIKYKWWIITSPLWSFIPLLIIFIQDAESVRFASTWATISGVGTICGAIGFSLRSRIRDKILNAPIN